MNARFDPDLPAGIQFDRPIGSMHAIWAFGRTVGDDDDDRRQCNRAARHEVHGEASLDSR